MEREKKFYFGNNSSVFHTNTGSIPSNRRIKKKFFLSYENQAFANNEYRKETPTLQQQ